MASATGQPEEKIAEDTDRDFFMTPIEVEDLPLSDLHRQPQVHTTQLPSRMIHRCQTTYAHRSQALDYGIIDEVIKTKTSDIKMPGMPSLAFDPK